MKVKLLFLVALVLIFMGQIIAQCGNWQNECITVSGVIYDRQTEKPFEGASVLVKGTWYGTISSKNGSFSVQIPNRSYKISVTARGYIPVEINILSNLTGDIERPVLIQKSEKEEVWTTDRELVNQCYSCYEKLQYHGLKKDDCDLYFNYVKGLNLTIKEKGYLKTISSQFMGFVNLFTCKDKLISKVFYTESLTFPQIYPDISYYNIYFSKIFKEKDDEFHGISIYDLRNYTRPEYGEDFEYITDHYRYVYIHDKQSKRGDLKLFIGEDSSKTEELIASNLKSKSDAFNRVMEHMYRRMAK